MPALIPRTPELADKIVEALAEDNLYKVTNTLGFPSRWTVIRWMDEDKEFATRCARAEKLRAAKRAAKIEELADECDEENFQSTKVKIATAQWLASKEDAKYGDKTQMEHSGEVGLNFVSKSILDKE